MDVYRPARSTAHRSPASNPSHLGVAWPTRFSARSGSLDFDFGPGFFKVRRICEDGQILTLMLGVVDQPVPFMRAFSFALPPRTGSQIGAERPDGRRGFAASVCDGLSRERSPMFCNCIHSSSLLFPNDHSRHARNISCAHARCDCDRYTRTRAPSFNRPTQSPTQGSLQTCAGAGEAMLLIFASCRLQPRGRTTTSFGSFRLLA